MNPADIITPAQLAERLQVPETWVYAKTRKRCQNPIPFIAVGRFIRFDWPTIVEWLRKQTENEKPGKH
jgi:predicted DNA-binding transcriptional regulator AlpA